MIIRVRLYLEGRTYRILSSDCDRVLIRSEVRKRGQKSRKETYFLKKIQSLPVRVTS